MNDNHAEASQPSQVQSQCLVYKKDTENNMASEVVTAIGGRDTALFLFRALGKILYCKSELFPSLLSECYHTVVIVVAGLRH